MVDVSILATTAVSDWTKTVGVPIAIAIIGLAGSVVVATLSFVFGRITDASSRRRDGYAAAQRTLVAYAEYPWRIRRRTSDSPEELARLAELGHELQQDLSYQGSWVRSENAWVGRVFDEVRQDLASVLAPACTDAWRAAPATKATDMSLGDWGPKGTPEALRRFESAVMFRFGWRRLPGLVRWHPGVRPRPVPPSAPAVTIVPDVGERTSA